MAFDILVKSNRIGSNPGGRCELLVHEKQVDAYIKYCNRSSMHPEAPLLDLNQPIYEALTFALARKLGLCVPDFAVVLNKNPERVNFTYESKSFDKLNNKKPYFFVTEVISWANQDFYKKTYEKQLFDEEIYRDLLIIDDITGRKQNYWFVPDENSEKGGHISYVDLGCSFVNVNEGTMSARSGKPPSSNKNDIKQANNIVKKYGVIKNDNEKVISLSEIVNSIYFINIPTINPEGTMPTYKLISEQELDELSHILKMSFTKTLRKYKEHPKLVKVSE